MLHRFEIHSAMELSRTALLGCSLAATTRGCLLVIRQFQLVVVQNGEEMYKKVCCKCEVVALPSKPIVSLTLSLPSRCRIVKVPNNSQVRYYTIRNSFIFSSNGLFSGGQKWENDIFFILTWACEFANVFGFVIMLRELFCFLCSVQPVICT